MASFIGANGGGDIVVNGRRFPMPPGGVGSVTVRNGVILVNGRTFPSGPSEADIKLAAKIEVQVSGGVQQVKTEMGGKVVVYGSVGSVETVNGDVVAESGIMGSVSTVNGNVTAKGEIGGSASSVNGNITGGKPQKKRKPPAAEKKKKPPRKKQRRGERKQQVSEDMAEFLFNDMVQQGPIQIGLSAAARGIASMFRSSGADSDSDSTTIYRSEPQGVSTWVTDQMTGECAICLEPLKKATQVRILDCLHKFCEACYAQWEQSKDNATCPTCRA